MAGQASSNLEARDELRQHLRARALSYLQRTPASSQRLKRRLEAEWGKLIAQEGDSEQNRNAHVESRDLIAEVCDEMAALELIDDHAYARGVMESLRRKGKSTHGIKAGLLQRDVPEHVITSLFDSSDQTTDQDRIAAATYVRRRKIGPLREANLALEATHAKDLATLMRQGFSYDIAAEIMTLQDEDAFEDWLTQLQRD